MQIRFISFVFVGIRLLGLFANRKLKTRIIEVDVRITPLYPIPCKDTKNKMTSLTNHHIFLSDMSRVVKGVSQPNYPFGEPGLHRQGRQVWFWVLEWAGTKMLSTFTER